MITAKRLFDLACVIPGIAALSPVYIAVGICIKLDSKGPILFRQERIGMNGKPFKVLKFRTMVPNAECLGPQLTTREDRRVTKLGVALRKFKIDEIPQLFNVLIGDMSLVGPRPEVPKYVDQYPENLKSIVLSVRPGITDKASIEFRDENRLLSGSQNPEETYIKHILPIKLKHYSDYVANNSIKNDIAIIFSTIKAITK